MNKMISKIMLGTLVIGAMPMHAHLGHEVQAGFVNAAAKVLSAFRNGSREALQTVAQNPGWATVGTIWALCNIGVLLEYKIKTAPCKRDLASGSAEDAAKNKAISSQEGLVNSRSQKPSAQDLPTDNVGSAHMETNSMPIGSAETVIITSSLISNEDNKRNIKKLIDEARWKAAGYSLVITVIAGFSIWAGSNISKACGWLGSKI